MIQKWETWKQQLRSSELTLATQVLPHMGAIVQRQSCGPKILVQARVSLWGRASKNRICHLKKVCLDQVSVRWNLFISTHGENMHN